jgi:hypothetical protein
MKKAPKVLMTSGLFFILHLSNFILYIMARIVFVLDSARARPLSPGMKKPQKVLMISGLFFILPSSFRLLPSSFRSMA